MFAYCLKSKTLGSSQLFCFLLTLNLKKKKKERDFHFSCPLLPVLLTGEAQWRQKGGDGLTTRYGSNAV